MYRHFGQTPVPITIELCRSQRQSKHESIEKLKLIDGDKNAIKSQELRKQSEDY